MEHISKVIFTLKYIFASKILKDDHRIVIIDIILILKKKTSFVSFY